MDVPMEDGGSITTASSSIPVGAIISGIKNNSPTILLLVVIGLLVDWSSAASALPGCGV